MIVELLIALMVWAAYFVVGVLLAVLAVAAVIEMFDRPPLRR